MPVSAVYVAGPPNSIVVTFNIELATDLLDNTRWSARFGDQTQSLPVANASGFEVVLTAVDAGPDIGPDIISYDDAAADVRSLSDGTPAESFTGLPLTV